MVGTGMRLLRTAGAALLLLGLAACAASPAGSAPRFGTSALQPGDGLTIEDATRDVVFDITSEKGIGKIEFERFGAAPETVTFKLRLKGLEEYRLTWGDQTVTGHYPSSGGPADPNLRIESENPTIPLQDGYFVLRAPSEFLHDAPVKFTLQWIDFYR